MLNNRALAASASTPKLYVEDVFSTYLYTGNGIARSITNEIDLSGKGGLTWIKIRDTTFNHILVDTLRGTGQHLSTNNNLSATFSDQDVTSFNNNGFSLGVNGRVNANNSPFVSWTFRKAEKFFDVITYTGNGVSNRTLNHNLNGNIGAVIIKRTDAADSWYVTARVNSTQFSVGDSGTPLRLNATASGGIYYSIGSYWTNSTFKLGTFWSDTTSVNLTGASYVAYVFAHDAGGFGDSGNESIIKCGSYVGNGSATGPVVNLGWEPQWILIKNITGATDDWVIFDSMRGVATNGNDLRLRANLTNAEDTTVDFISFTSTGFQPTTTISDVNANGSNYIYIAIRRGPMKTPTDATKVFKAVTQTSQGTVSTDFPVDMVIMGDRSSTWGYNWSVQDRLRGKSAVLFTSATTAENTTSLSTFDSNTSFKDGWVSGGTSAVYETFRRAPGFFDVVAYTGTGSARTINHNLGVVPELMIIKSRSTVQPWPVYSAIDYARSGNILRLNSLDGAVYNFASRFNAVPTSSVFSVGNDTETNSNGVNYTAYLFASLLGISKVGSYTGSGTTKQIDCGFTNGARFVMIKRTNTTGGWYVWDSARGIIPGNDPYLLLNQTNGEVTDTDYIDAYSAGFEISSTAPAEINANGGSFIFLAIA